MNPAVTAKLARVVSTLMAKSPADRPRSAAAARDLLLPFAARPATLPQPTLRDTVGAVDTPEILPELWTDDSDSEGRATHEPSSVGSLPLLYMPPDSPEETAPIPLRTWLYIGGGLLLVVLLILVLVIILK